MNVALRRAFVTGGSGFVGGNLIALLKSRGDAVRALSRSDAAIKTVQQLGAEPVRGDLDNVEALRRGMSGCDVVFHSAAKVEDWGRYEDFYRANVSGTENVLRAARAMSVRKFIHVSTEAVLAGGPPIHNADETWPRAKNPLGLYPLTKGLAEERVLAADSPELITVIVPLWFVQTFARVFEIIWSGLHLKSRPPITRTAVCLMGEEVTVDDAKVRRELGYVGEMSIEAGLAELML
jgi:nucleoside-diphosphate-sugar epimerase